MAASSLEAAATLPTYKCVEMAMYRARHSVHEKLPKSIEELTLSEEHIKTKDGKEFLLIDDGEGKSRFLVCFTHFL